MPVLETHAVLTPEEASTLIAQLARQQRKRSRSLKVIRVFLWCSPCIVCYCCFALVLMLTIWRNLDELTALILAIAIAFFMLVAISWYASYLNLVDRKYRHERSNNLIAKQAIQFFLFQVCVIPLIIPIAAGIITICITIFS